MTITFFVSGVPKPAGSKRHVGRGIIVDSSGAPGREWRALVQDRCNEAIAYAGPKPAIAAGPVALRVTFYLPRPKGHYRTNGQLKPNAPHFHTGRPDTTKLLRAIEDAITGIAWKDDAQVAVQVAHKLYGNEPGAMVTINCILPDRDAPRPAECELASGDRTA